MMHYVVNPRCVVERVEDGIILLNEDNGNTIVLNETATFLYDHADMATDGSMIQSLLSVLDDTVDMGTVIDDCKECIGQMVGAGILLVVEDV